MPTILNESAINDRTIIIQWEPVECSHRNGKIVGYTVIYYPAGEMPKSMVTNVSDSSFIAMGLVFETEYIFEIQAINNYGTGPSANTAHRTSALQGKYTLYLLNEFAISFFFRSCDCL